MPFRGGRRLRSRFALALAGAGAGVALSACGTQGRLVAPAATEVRSTQAEVRVGGPAAVAPTSRSQSFVGVASELPTLPALAGTPSAPDVPFAQLLKNLAPGSRFSLRIGGHSADLSWWAIPGQPRPHGVSYTLTPAWAADVKALLASIGGTALIGVNLEADSSAVAAYEIGQLERALGPGPIRAFELGNEPELYPVFPYYVAAHRKLVFSRPRTGYTIPVYGRDFSRVAAGLGSAPLAGPGVGAVKWLASLGEILQNLPSRIKVVTVHAYPLIKCSATTHHPVTAFFTPASISGLASAVGAMVRAAAAHGKPLRVAEINGVSCGGEAGLSNAFAEALWALNILPALWQAGVEGVNFQTINGDLNQVFTTSHSAAGWKVTVQPVYYGLLAFAQTATAGSRLLSVSGPAPGAGGLYRWAVRQPDGTEKVVLTNVGASAQTVSVSAPGSGPGSVSLLTAGSLGATSGETLGGQTLSSSTGALTGAPRAITVTASHGSYVVKVPAHSAAILTVGR